MSPAGRLRRFLAVGVGNCLVSLAVFSLLMALLPAAFGRAGVAQAVSYGCGILWSFGCNRSWTFGDRSADGGAFARFLALQLTLLVASSATVAVGTELHPSLLPQVIWVVVMTVVTLLNYVTQSRLVFVGAR